MEDTFRISLSDWVCGPDELDWLLKEWAKDPRPKTVGEIARILMNRQYEVSTGFLPYDIRGSYKEKDKIIVLIREDGFLDPVPAPVEVLRVTKGYYNGYNCDYIDVRLLSTDPKLDSQKIRTFIANYQGPGFSIPQFKAFEIITEKDESEVIPKILGVISNDKRFVAFGGKWLPSELLKDFSDKISDVEKFISECNHALSTGEILEKLQIGSNEDNLNSCLEFSLNHSLKKDKRFVRVSESESVIKWRLRNQVSKPVPEHWTLTIQTEWLEKGILIIPKELANRMQGTNTVHILYDQLDEVLPYEERDRLIEGLNDFYSIKAIAEFDKVHLRLEGLEPTRLFIAATWQRSLNELLSIEPQDLNWEHSSLRDCIIVTLAKFKTPMHYREIYTEIAPHKNISVNSIDATLSRYSPSVFVRAGSGKWQLGGWEGPPKPPDGGKGEKDSKVSQRPPVPDDKEIWKVVQLIEEKDYVYKLLQKIRRPLSFNDICKIICRVLEPALKVDADKLKTTGFLKADDKRLRRLDDGTWALEEWFEPSPPKPPEQQQNGLVKPEKRSLTDKIWLVLKSLVVSVKRCYSRFFNRIFRQ